MKLMDRLVRGVLVGLFMMIGCSRPADYLYLHPNAQSFSVTQKIKDVTGSADIDLFWVIGGMTEQAANFQTGITSFMQTFTTKPYQWRMAVSGSNLDGPVLGMPNTLGAPPLFDTTDPNPTPDFVNGVMSALNGDDQEKIFDPISYNLSMNSSFIRPNATLVVIMTNDAHDYSANVAAQQMLQYLASLKGGDIHKVVVYGIFGAVDLGCDPFTIDESWNFHGTPFEQVINATGGQVYSLCDATFGTSLAQLGDDLYQRLDFPRIYLNEIPDPNSIQVWFQNQTLPGGPQASGGLWYYDVKTNSVVFYNLNFAAADTDQVTVTFQQNLGEQ